MTQKMKDKIKKPKAYDEQSIERYAGLQGIRKTPGTYIGPSDSSGLWTIFRELGDNHVDQTLAGRNTDSYLIDEGNGVYWAFDTGPGIPVGKKEFENEHGQKEKLSVLYVATGLTHAGSHFSGNEISRGVHGLGQKTTNAMSKSFTVWTHREGKWYCIEYKDAKLHKDTYECKAPKLPFGLKVKKGTVIRFEPDLKLFMKNSQMPLEELKQWCRLTSLLVPQITVHFVNAKGKEKVFHSKGPEHWLKSKCEELQLTQTGKTFAFKSSTSDVIVAFTDMEGSNNVAAYTNGLNNKEGGEQLKALQDALVKSLRLLSKKKKTGSGKSKKEGFGWNPQDVLDGLVGLVNFKISAPKFSDQPKTRLIDERVYAIAYAELLDAWNAFWKKNKGMAKELIARAETIREKTADFLKDKKLIKKVKDANKKLSTKLAGIVGSTPAEDRELYLVEGDSAGGGAKRARNKKTQAVFPMRGKPLNVLNAKKEQINNNEEIATILAAIGVSDKEGQEDKINYGKIILMADSDVDGKHINTLLLGLIYKFKPSLFSQGRVFAVRGPLFKGKYKSQVYFGSTKEEIWKACSSKNADITYLKGWGELNESDLWVALDPTRRTLDRIVVNDRKRAKEIEFLLGPKPEYRKKLLRVA